MQRSIFDSAVPPHLQANFRTLDKSRSDSVERSLRSHYFSKQAETYLSTERGAIDLEDHLFGRLNTARTRIIPWLDEVRSLQNLSILEIGCGTGCCTVALAEQGARVTALDMDQPSLMVAAERCSAYGVEATFVHANAAAVAELFPGHHFDWIIFDASLEHMTIPERLSAMRATWAMLADGDLWTVIETPNRLWYFDSHTSLLPFHMWLPDELAYEYSRFSPRENYRELYRQRSAESELHFLRRGRSVSFHEFDLAMKPASALKVRSSLNTEKHDGGFLRFLKRRSSAEQNYLSLLRGLAPELHEAFLQSGLYLIIEKD